MLSQGIIKQLREIVGRDGVLDAPEDLVAYSIDGTFAEHRPDVVVLPTTTDQVSRIVALASRERIPIVPRGMASGLAAASIPFSGGMALTLTRMNRILEIDQANRTARVEAGIITAHLQAEVEKLGLFYPPD
ncbi:MAG: FAD-binding oxidoreductase, partial [Anaerolineae bacterium]|nr:FAD-binding oxidoreductase [Anaerolineae bacterium]